MANRSIIIFSFIILSLLALKPALPDAAIYQYDDLNRLTRVEHQDGIVTIYTYDALGNRKSKVVSGIDSDNDRLSDSIENNSCTDANDADTDDDGIMDGDEDFNRDGVLNSNETDPCTADTDSDGIQDGTELGMSIPVVDPDGTGPLLGTETAVFQPDLDPLSTTNPLEEDTDQDGLPDGIEDANQNGMVDPGETDPNNSDSDGDGFSDGFEDDLGMDPLYPDTTDSDGDGLVDGMENANCTDANNVDTDGDTLSDGDEDANRNGVLDPAETNPCDADTDGDGYPDGYELAMGFDPNDENDHPLDPSLEGGTIQADHNWLPVALNQAFYNPIVVAGPFSSYGSDPAIVRIRNVTPTGFEIRLQEFDYDDGSHKFETISYLVMESGDFILTDGTRISAGSFNTSTCNAFDTLSFGLAFSETPVVLTSVGTTNDPSAVVSRVQNVNQDGFYYGLQEEQAADQIHGEETIHYIAWEPFSGYLGDHIIEAGNTDPLVNDNYTTIRYSQAFSETPVFVANLQTAIDMDPAVLRYRNNNNSQVQVKVGEEKSGDGEMDHGTEAVGFLAMHPIDYSLDSDGDGLSDYGEINIHGTNPENPDTDNDGLSDDLEVATHFTDPLNPDTDGDGHTDGFEVTHGTDPNNENSYPTFPRFETGSVSANQVWVPVSYVNAYSSPVVIAGPMSNKGSAPAFVRIRNITSTGFEIRVQEYDYLNDIHSTATISYLVMEAGDYTLADGTHISAGSFATSLCNNFATITFNEAFTEVPVVVTSVGSYNDASAVVSRLRSININGFEQGLQEEEAGDQIHGEEIVHYVAWEPFEGPVADNYVEVGRTNPVVTHGFTQIDFIHAYINPPYFVTDMQSANDMDTAGLRYKRWYASGFQIWIDEEQSQDNEVSHSEEVVGYMVFGAP